MQSLGRWTWMVLACFGIALAPARAAESLQLKPTRLAAHTWFFQGEPGMASTANKGFMSNAGFVVTGDSVLVFDALATPALGEAMVAAIRTVTPLPIKRVIVSHYHADHFYGLQAFKGAEVWAHENGKAAIASDGARDRLAQRREALAPWVDAQTRLVPADRWLAFGPSRVMAFEMGGLHFRLFDAHGAHSGEDLILMVDEDKVLFAGDLFVTGRIPFVGDANSRVWLGEIERMLAVGPRIAVPGHGAASSAPAEDMRLTRDYLLYLREKMGAAAADLVPFDGAYGKVDWSRFSSYPAFEQSNHLNAYGTYLLMENESLRKP